MKNIQRYLFAIIALTFYSCLEPDPINDNELINTEDQIHTSTEVESAIAQQNTQLLGQWITTHVQYTENIETTNTVNPEQPTTESIEKTGIGYDLNQTINFLEVPTIALGEGIYSLDIEITNNQETTTQQIVGLSLISSQTFWVLEGDQLTLEAGGKIRTAVVTELTPDTLILEFYESMSTTTDDESQTTVKQIIFEFVKA